MSSKKETHRVVGLLVIVGGEKYSSFAPQQPYKGGEAKEKNTDAFVQKSGFMIALLVQLKSNKCQYYGIEYQKQTGAQLHTG